MGKEKKRICRISESCFDFKNGDFSPKKKKNGKSKEYISFKVGHNFMVALQRFAAKREVKVKSFI